MGPFPTYRPPEGEECKTLVEHGLPLWAEPAVGYCSRRPRPSPMWGSRFVGARAVGPWVAQQRPHGKTLLGGNPSPGMTYLPYPVKSVPTEDWSDDYAASVHWGRYWNAVGAPSDDEWPEGLTGDRDKLFLKDKLLVPESRVEELIDHRHNAQLMHPGRDKMQQDVEPRFKFPAVYYAIHDRYCSSCAVSRAEKSQNHSTAGNQVYTAIPEAPMRSVTMDVFAMPEVTVEEEIYDCVILAVDRHSGYIVAVPGKKFRKKDKKDKHGVGPQAKTSPTQ